MRLFLAFLLVLLVVPSIAASQSLQHRFAGEAQVGEEPPSRVHVELADDRGSVSGKFATEDTEFDFSGSRRGNTIGGTLTAGDPIGTVQLHLTPEGARGNFDLAGAKGTLTLRHTLRDASSYLRPVQNIDLTPQQWREDLEELASILTTKHGGPFEHVSKKTFAAKLNEARRRVSSGSGIKNALLFRKLAALIGDGHTEVALVGGRPLYPLETFSFEDGLRVIATSPKTKSLLGAKLVAINGVPVKEVADRLRTYIGQYETAWAYRSSFPWLLQRADLLEDSRIASGRSARFTFRVASKRRVVTIKAGPPRKDLVRYGRGLPLWERKPDDGFWYDRWADGTVYVNWRSYEDLDAKSAALLSDLDKQRPRRLILDLRDNGGGDFNIGRRFIEQLSSRPWLNKRGVLFQLLGRGTFSAATTNSVDLKLRTNATLVGEPAGAAPNGWQESRTYYLPNSGLRVSVSTKKYQFLPGKRQVHPHVLIPAKLSDWAAEKDDATEYIIRQPQCPLSNHFGR